jgi:uncharacterized protein (TIGR02453 family)
MLQPGTIAFLQKLAKNNNKVWFDAHREEYQQAKKDFEDFTEALISQMKNFDPSLHDVHAKDCVFRIFKDVRFAKDKVPYKANFAAAISKNGRKFSGAGYYIHIEPNGKSMLGGGMYMPEAPQLKALRQEIDYNFKEFKGLLGAAAFKKHFKGVEGEKLKKPPQGFDAENPAIEYLKMKSLIVMKPLDDATLSEKAFLKNCVAAFSAMKPFMDFLNRAQD